ncbi:hypothetical protein T06_13999 [Trichinella sp. T6]|nr:hypothetical protein T06_13999 [Trichinella sp. T6]
MPSIAHASYTSLAYQRMNQLHEHRQFKADSSLMDTQPCTALHQSDFALEFRYNISLGILNFYPIH